MADRIRHLEAIVRQEAPHVDLSVDTGAQVDRGSVHEGSSTSVAHQSPNNPAANTEQPLGSTISPSFGIRDSANIALRPVGSPFAGLDHSNTSSAGSLAHEVGLVSLSEGADPKYVGPSSGVFFTQMLGVPTKDNRPRSMETTHAEQAPQMQRDRELAMRVFEACPQSLPPSKDLAKQLSKKYFRTVHVQYPFMHEHTHMRLIDLLYDHPGREGNDMALFHVTMVLAIAALITSRRARVELPANGWCAAAMAHFKKMEVPNSLEALQCLLLQLTYGLHSPSFKYNTWNLLYQCLAMLTDLGLHRKAANNADSSFLRRHMRSRVFWVVYTIDRRLSTMLGRPLGFRDEACDVDVSTTMYLCTSLTLAQSGPKIWTISLWRIGMHQDRRLHRRHT